MYDFIDDTIHVIVDFLKSPFSRGFGVVRSSRSRDFAAHLTRSSQ